MSRYAINSLLYHLKKDPALRARFLADPGGAIAGADLTDAERAAFVAGDMRTLNELGGYLHLVMSVPRIGTHGARDVQPREPLGAPGSRDRREE